MKILVTVTSSVSSKKEQLQNMELRDKLTKKVLFLKACIRTANEAVTVGIFGQMVSIMSAPTNRAFATEKESTCTTVAALTRALGKMMNFRESEIIK